MNLKIVPTGNILLGKWVSVGPLCIQVPAINKDLEKVWYRKAQVLTRNAFDDAFFAMKEEWRAHNGNISPSSLRSYFISDFRTSLQNAFKDIGGTSIQVGECNIRGITCHDF